jgi:hypothetical protein
MFRQYPPHPVVSQLRRREFNIFDVTDLAGAPEMTNCQGAHVSVALLTLLLTKEGQITPSHTT